MQKLISFDIGIKNMAFCLFDVASSPPSIQKWDVLNLMDAVENTQPLCTCNLKGKPAKKSAIASSPKVCNKKAKYEKHGTYYCEKHATEHTEFEIPNKEHSPPVLRKMKSEQLLAIYEKYFIFRKNPGVGTLDAFCQPNGVPGGEPEKIPTTKKGLLDKMLAFYEEKCFRVLQPPKKKTANETDLISIGRNMTKLLDEMHEITDGTITHVILENQISTIANRMKTIQGMLAQYFIMRGRQDIVIEFVSSSNKLKDFVAEKNTTYKQHKKDGITICSRFLENNPNWTQWGSVLQTTKRDDLADSFLQGIWYLKRGNIISYAENLKINSV
uniref:Mitochondrial resolvase Ydc2 catalytic domain-containing protein n=1 Tax=viral metagenome TaxID=1070528 RepID=A0A6C0K1W8_9ZZZZ